MLLLENMYYYTMTQSVTHIGLVTVSLQVPLGW